MLERNRFKVFIMKPLLLLYTERNFQEVYMYFESKFYFTSVVFTPI